MSFVLGAHAARSCPVKTQNAFLPAGWLPAVDDEESTQEAFAGGVKFEAEILADVVAHCPGVTDLRPLADEPWAVRERACHEAMAAGAAVIVGGVVPLDEDGHRSGNADLWVRGPDNAHGGPGYFPVEVKAHRVHERRPQHTLSCSTLAAPRHRDTFRVEGVAFRLGNREGDLLQVSHYWRLLEAAGFAAGGPPWAGIVGTDKVPGVGHVVTWVDLSERQIRTYSRSAAAGWRLRSALERYDHEHAFRVRVAKTAQAQTGEPGDPPLLVRPIVMRECDHCEWWEVCRPQLPDEDLSLRIDKAPLDVREISVLRALGVATIDQLAEADLDELLPRYLPQVAHRPGAEERLRLATRRAILMANGVDLERIGGALRVPGSDVEIDFDIETAANDRVYLWGFLLTDRRTGAARYVDFSDFSEFGAAGELDLARRAMGWLRELAGEHADALVFHYSDYELVRLARLADDSGDETLAWARRWLLTHGVDLFALVKRHYFGVHGLGLKTVATAAAGFEWRDDDPGGLNSQAWFDEAVHGESAAVRDAARTRVLEYNEDDVRATAALRRWLRTQAD